MKRPCVDKEDRDNPEWRETLRGRCFELAIARRQFYTILKIELRRKLVNLIIKMFY